MGSSGPNVATHWTEGTGYKDIKEAAVRGAWGSNGEPRHFLGDGEPIPL